MDVAAARLLVPFRDGTEAATVAFDEGARFPSSYRVPRFRSRGPKVGWRVDVREWARIAGIAWPRRVVVTWADEPGPWYVLPTDRVELDVDADDALNRARVALVEAS